MIKFLKKIWYAPLIGCFAGLLSGIDIEFKYKVLYIILFAILLYFTSRLFKKLMERKRRNDKFKMDFYKKLV